MGASGTAIRAMGETRGMRTVLVVDDDATLREAYKRTLGERTVLTAATRAEALDLARKWSPELAIVDLRLGTDSGLELIPELKNLLPDLYVVMVSGWGSIDATVHAMRAGADDVLAKPITFAELLQRVDRAERVAANDTPTLERAEWEHITRVLADCNGNVSQTARRLGITRSTLQRRLRKQRTSQ